MVPFGNISRGWKNDYLVGNVDMNLGKLRVIWRPHNQFGNITINPEINPGIQLDFNQSDFNQRTNG